MKKVFFFKLIFTSSCVSIRKGVPHLRGVPHQAGIRFAQSSSALKNCPSITLRNWIDPHCRLGYVARGITPFAYSRHFSNAAIGQVNGLSNLPFSCNKASVLEWTPQYSVCSYIPKAKAFSLSDNMVNNFSILLVDA